MPAILHLLTISIGMDPNIAKFGSLQLTWHGIFTAVGIAAGVYLGGTSADTADVNVNLQHPLGHSGSFPCVKPMRETRWGALCVWMVAENTTFITAPDIPLAPPRDTQRPRANCTTLRDPLTLAIRTSAIRKRKKEKERKRLTQVENFAKLTRILFCEAIFWSLLAAPRSIHHSCRG